MIIRWRHVRGANQNLRKPREIPQGHCQWRNSRGVGAGRGGRVSPRDFSPGNFCWPIGKREGRKKGKMEKENRKREDGKLKIGGKVAKWGEDLVFVLFLFLFLLFTFQNHWNLFRVYQNGNFLSGKSISHREKIRKNDFAPSEKFSSYAPAIAGGR